MHFVVETVLKSPATDVDKNLAGAVLSDLKTVKQLIDAIHSGSTVTAEIVATADIAAFQVVNADGTPTNADNPVHQNKAVGISLEAISTGFSGDILMVGEVTNPAWSWTVNDIIYLNGTSLTTTAPTVGGFAQKIGVAKSATIIEFQLGPAIKF